MSTQNTHRQRTPFASPRFVVWSATDRTDPSAKSIATSPTLTSGAGAPSHTEPQGSAYIRTDGAAGTTLYVNTDGATTWTALADVNAAILSDGTVTITAASGSVSETGLVNLDLSGSGTSVITGATGATLGLVANSGSNYSASLGASNAGAGQGNLNISAKTAVAFNSGGAATVDFLGSGAVSFTAPLKSNTVGERTAGDGVTVDSLLIKDGAVQSNDYIKATIAVADAPGGATTAALTVDCYLPDGTTRISAARQIMIHSNGTSYDPSANYTANLTFGTATKGSIIASGNGWCLAQTDTAGEFDCTATNTDDNIAKFSVSVPPRGCSDVTLAPVSVVSNSDSAEWSA